VNDDDDRAGSHDDHRTSAAESISSAVALALGN
jgi:hypothetical protein